MADLTNAFYSFLTLLSYIGENLKNFFIVLSLPFQWYFTYLQNYFSTCFGAPIAPEGLWTIDSQAKSVVEAIPYYSTITTVLAIIILATLGVVVVKLIAGINLSSSGKE